MADSVIETGVDKLVKLIERKMKISVNEAAVELGVPSSVIEEWSDFLEEEGIISIEYKLTNTFLVVRKMSEKEINKKEKEFHGKKEGFVRKVEGSLNALERESQALEAVKKEFDQLQSTVGSEIDSIKDRLKELEKYEKIKKEIDDDLFQHQEQFKARIAEVETQIMAEEKKYMQIQDDLKIEKVKVEQEREKVHSMEDRETHMLAKLDEVQTMLNQIRKEVKGDEDLLEESDKHIEKLREFADEVREDVEKKRSKLSTIFDESKEKEKEIGRMQDDLIEEMRKKKADIDKDVVETTELTEKVDSFFKKKKEINAILDKVLIDRDILKREFHELIKKATAFDIASKGGSTKKNIEELKKKYNDLEDKKSFFQKELERLQELILGNK